MHQNLLPVLLQCRPNCLRRMVPLERTPTSVSQLAPESTTTAFHLQSEASCIIQRLNQVWPTRQLRHQSRTLGFAPGSLG
jgi:hypothetical protein